MKKGFRSALVSTTAAAAAAVGLLAAAPAGAQTVSGWVGPTTPVGGVVYLNQSTISNTPLTASVRIYTAFGNVAPPHTMMVQTRLFKSGALCVINDYKENATNTASLSDATTGDCGPGSYNSHGFTFIKNADVWQSYVSFPTNPLNYPATAAAASTTDKAATNSKGQTYGSAASAKTFADQPDLISAYGTDGELGYIRKSDLAAPPSGSATAARKAAPTSTLQVFTREGAPKSGVSFRLAGGQ